MDKLYIVSTSDGVGYSHHKTKEGALISAEKYAAIISYKGNIEDLIIESILYD